MMNFQLLEEREDLCKAAASGILSSVISYIFQPVTRYLQIVLLLMVNKSKLMSPTSTQEKVRQSKTIDLLMMKVKGIHSSMLILMSLREAAKLLSVVLDVHQQEVSKENNLILAKNSP